MNKTNNNLTAILQELHKAFDCLNNAFYQGELPSVIITVQTKGKTNANGWFTPAKIWDDGTEQKHEINITAESLKREYIDIIRTLHHEMIHLYCHINDIKDVSRGNTYHNARFKKACEEHGFVYNENSYDKKYGWSFAALSEETIETICAFDVDANVFKLHRAETMVGDEQKKKKSNIIKWVCGCGVIVRSSKDGLKLICGECGSYFKKEGDDAAAEDGQ